MVQQFPFFSIVIPTYNRAHLIAKTLESILQQTYEDFEVLVVDDGSKDNTEEVVRRFTDTRIQYFKKANAERGAARNYGAARAKGTYINFVDSDDIIYPNHLAVAFAFVEKCDGPEFFHLGYDNRLVNGTLLKRVNDFTTNIKEQLLFDNRLSCNGVFLQKSIIERYQFEENRALASSEDWELWIRLLCRYRFQFSNEVTSAVINHDQRSLFTIPADEVETRDLLLIANLKKDSAVTQTYGTRFGRFVAERYTFFMLSYSQEAQRAKVWKWATRAFLAYPLILVSKRFLASMKNSILK